MDSVVTDAISALIIFITVAFCSGAAFIAAEHVFGETHYMPVCLTVFMAVVSGLCSFIAVHYAFFDA